MLHADFWFACLFWLAKMENYEMADFPLGSCLFGAEVSALHHHHHRSRLFQFGLRGLSGRRYPAILQPLQIDMP